MSRLWCIVWLVACSRELPERRTSPPVPGPTVADAAARPVEGSTAIDAVTAPPDAGGRPPAVVVETRCASYTALASRLVTSQAQLARVLPSCAWTIDFSRSVGVIVPAGSLNGRTITVSGWTRRGDTLEVEVLTHRHCTGGANRGDDPTPTLFVVHSPGPRRLVVVDRLVDDWPKQGDCPALP